MQEVVFPAVSGCRFLDRKASSRARAVFSSSARLDVRVPPPRERGVLHDAGVVRVHRAHRLGQRDDVQVVPERRADGPHPRRVRGGFSASVSRAERAAEVETRRRRRRAVLPSLAPRETSLIALPPAGRRHLHGARAAAAASRERARRRRALRRAPGGEASHDAHADARGKTHPPTSTRSPRARALLPRRNCSSRFARQLLDERELSLRHLRDRVLFLSLTRVLIHQPSLVILPSVFRLESTSGRFLFRLALEMRVLHERFRRRVREPLHSRALLEVLSRSPRAPPSRASSSLASRCRARVASRRGGDAPPPFAPSAVSRSARSPPRARSSAQP